MSQINKQLALAVRYLYGKGVISKDRDIADMTGYNKTSVSSYLSGNVKPSSNFISKFQEVFKVDLSQFKEGANNQLITVEDPIQVLTEKILRIEAIQRVNQSLLIEVLATVSGRTVTELHRSVERATQEDLKLLLSELQRD